MTFWLGSQGQPAILSFRPSVASGEISCREALRGIGAPFTVVSVSPAFRARFPGGATFSIDCPRRTTGLLKIERSSNAKNGTSAARGSYPHVQASRVRVRARRPHHNFNRNVATEWCVECNIQPPASNICVYLRNLRFLRMGRRASSLSPFPPCPSASSKDDPEALWGSRPGCRAGWQVRYLRPSA